MNSDMTRTEQTLVWIANIITCVDVPAEAALDNLVGAWLRAGLEAM